MDGAELGPSSQAQAGPWGPAPGPVLEEKHRILTTIHVILGYGAQPAWPWDDPIWAHLGAGPGQNLNQPRHGSG